MKRFHMSVKIRFLSCLVVTKLTTILDSFINGFHMFFKIWFPSCLVVTKFTTEFDSFVNRFHMYFKICFSSCLIVTLISESSDKNKIRGFRRLNLLGRGAVWEVLKVWTFRNIFLRAPLTELKVDTIWSTLYLQDTSTMHKNVRCMYLLREMSFCRW